MDKCVVVINSKDNVGTVVDDLLASTDVKYKIENNQGSVRLLQDIPNGHKVAIHPILVGENIVKYGESIGRATSAILPGQHVHVQNLESLRGRGDL